MQPSGDDLLLREGLPEPFRYLAAQCPRQDWSTPGRIHATAKHWLDIHRWFRGALGELTGLGGKWRAGGLDPADYQAAVMPRLRQFLSHLEGHHNIESHSYFPALAALEPPMAAGFELLDRDHEAVHGLLVGMAEAANGLNRALPGGGDVRPQGDALAAAIAATAGPLLRHLSDEEEIVIPVLTLRGDPMQPAPRGARR